MIKVLSCTKEPLSFIGQVASTCWNSKPSKDIAIKCLESNHGRVLEYPDVTIEIKDYSARMIRELYTHCIGVTRLQQSTRYVDYKNFNYYIPYTIKDNPNALSMYDSIMGDISTSYQNLYEMGIPKEDIANILPLGMTSTVVLKINLRAILHMFEERTCSRAYVEFREFMKEFKSVLIDLDEDWKYIIENYAKTKCEKVGFCKEAKSCDKFKAIGKA